LIQATLPSVYEGFKGLDRFQAGLGFWVLLIAIMVFALWIYRLHEDLVKRFQGYPTTPRRAMAQCFIPFYNFWGLPPTFRTLAGRLKSEDGQLAVDGKALDKWTQWFTSAIGAEVLLAVRRQLLVDPAILDGTLFSLLNSAVELFLAIVWLRITLIVSRMMADWEPAAIRVPNAAVDTLPIAPPVRPIWGIALICGVVTFVAVCGIGTYVNVSGLSANASGYDSNAAYETASTVGFWRPPWAQS
jgi:hypothetical protein